MTVILIIGLAAIFILGIYAGFRQQAAKDESINRIRGAVMDRMDALNAMQVYQPQIIPAGPHDYEPLPHLAAETEGALATLTQLTSVLDTQDASQPVYLPRNLDLYFESWRIMRFTDFAGALDKETHFHLLQLACGKYFLEQYRLEWHRKAAGRAGEPVLLHRERGIELSPIDSMMRSVARNETDVFTALENALCSCLETGATQIRIE